MLPKTFIGYQNFPLVIKEFLLVTKKFLLVTKNVSLDIINFSLVIKNIVTKNFRLRPAKEKHLPYTVKNRSVWKYADVDIRHDDVVEVAFFLVRKEQVRHPNTIGFRKRKILEFPTEIIEFESFVEPLFSESELNAVFLQHQPDVTHFIDYKIWGRGYTKYLWLHSNGTVQRHSPTIQFKDYIYNRRFACIYSQRNLVYTVK